jgi:hypothetical protein
MSQRLSLHWHSLVRRLLALIRSRDGGILVTFGLALTGLIGIGGMGLESGIWYTAKRSLQTQADAAAISGAFERAKGNPSGVTLAAQREATRNGFSSAAPNSIAIHNPPISGPNTGEGEAVEAVLARDQKLLLASLFLDTLTIRARAVAAVQVTGTACVLALDPTASGAVTNQGSTIVNMAGCSVAANSSSETAITVSGNGSLLADSLWTVGNYNKDGSSTLTLAKPPVVHAWELDDPYANVHVPTLSGCNHTNLDINTATTLDPGIYCGGLHAKSQGVVTMNPGTYYMDAGDFQVDGGAVFRCNCVSSTDGVTIVMTSTGAASSIGKVTINGGADMVLHAPTNAGNPFAGLLFYGDPDAPAGTDKFNGGSEMNLTGAIYMPKHTVQWSGNNGSTAPTCTQIIANTVVFIGNSTINNNGCQAAGVQPLTITGVKVVE